MIETVQERQRGAFDFGSYYDNLCALQDACPVLAVKAHLAEGVLDVNGDRIRALDWEPIFNSLRINKNLHFIALRSYFQLAIDNSTGEKRAVVIRSKIPAIRSKELTFSLCRSLRECIIGTEVLNCLELQGLPLRERDLSALCKGITKNKTLHHLSLEFCRFGDIGLDIVCAALKTAGNITTLNLTSCSLTARSGETLANLIKYQAMCRHNEAWKESLRYRRPNLDSMSGLRRITLNRNPLLEDRGALVLAEAIKDDLWVKAVDMQGCGLASESARAFLGVLKFNSTLVVLDLRQNPLIDRDLLRAVTEQVLVNGDGKDTEFKWLKDTAPDERSPVKVRPSSASAVAGQHAYGKGMQEMRRPVFRPAGNALTFKSANSGRSSRVGGKSAALGVRQTGRRPRRAILSTGMQPRKGLPWRTAARASRYKGYPPDHEPGRSHLDENSENLAMKANSEEEEDDDLEEESDLTVDSVVDPLVREYQSSPPPPATLKALKIQLTKLQRQITDEQLGRKKAEQRITELLVENRSLKGYGETKRGPSGSRPAEVGPVPSDGLLDEDVIANIEQSFRQFHAFLDLLRDAGLGRVVTAAGMDHFTTPTSARLRLSQESAPTLSARQQPASRPTTLPKPQQMNGSVATRSQGLLSSSNQRPAAARLSNQTPQGSSKFATQQSRPKMTSSGQRITGSGDQPMARSLTSETRGRYTVGNHGDDPVMTDPVDASYAKSKRTRTEADRIFSQLKEATEATLSRDRDDLVYGGNNQSQFGHHPGDDVLIGQNVTASGDSTGYMGTVDSESFPGYQDKGLPREMHNYEPTEEGYEQGVILESGRRSGSAYEGSSWTGPSPSPPPRGSGTPRSAPQISKSSERYSSDTFEDDDEGNHEATALTSESLPAQGNGTAVYQHQMSLDPIRDLDTDEE